jgi:hypothetical protein
MRSRKNRSRAPALVAAAAVALAIAADVVRRRRAAGSGGASSGSAPEPGRRAWTCACGQELRVSGVDRHRVWWLPDAEPGSPILGDRCPACDESLLAQPN